MIHGIGAAAVTGTALSSTGAADTGDSDGGGKVIYSDSAGKVLKVGPHHYVINGAESRRAFDHLVDKRKEILKEGEEVTTLESKSGSDNDQGTYQGEDWSVETDMTAHTSTTEAEPEGIASAQWYGDAYWVDDPVEVDEIEITSRLSASFDSLETSVDISAPPSYEVSNTTTRLDATLSSTFEDSSGPSLSHNQGAVTFYGGDGSCLNWVEQDDAFKFDYGSDVEFYGTTVRLDFDHCSWW